MSEGELRHEPVFNENLEPTEFRPTIYSLENKPDTLVRIETLTGDEAAIDARVTHWSKNQALFNELANEYGIPNSGISVVRGKDAQGAETIYAVTKRIVGENLETSTTLPPEAIEEIDTFYTKTAEYLLDKFNKSQEYLADFFGPSQLVYGTKPGETEKHLYVVDIGPEVFPFKKGETFQVLASLEMVAIYITEIEEKLPAGERLVKARETIQRILDTMPLDMEELGVELHVDNIKEKLDF